MAVDGVSEESERTVKTPTRCPWALGILFTACMALSAAKPAEAAESHAVHIDCSNTYHIWGLDDWVEYEAVCGTCAGEHNCYFDDPEFLFTAIEDEGWHEVAGWWAESSGSYTLSAVCTGTSATRSFKVVDVDTLDVPSGTYEEEEDAYYVQASDTEGATAAVVATLTPATGANELPPGFITWTADDATLPTGATQLECALPISATGTFDVCVQAGGNAPVYWVTVVVWDYTVDLQVCRKGTEAWGSAATVAAGGKSSDEHKAEIKAWVSDNNQMPVAGQTFYLTIKDAAQTGHDATGLATLSNTSRTTASDGTFTVTYTSGSKVVDGVVIEVRKKNEPTAPVVASVSIDQKWDTRVGTSGWSYDNYVMCGEPSLVSLAVVLGSNTELPLVGHKIQFYPTKVLGWKWDDIAEEYKLWVAYDTDLYTWAEITSEHPNAEMVEGHPGLAAYADFDQDGEDYTNAQGVATRYLTVHEDSNGGWFVTDVYFWASDRDVWED